VPVQADIKQRRRADLAFLHDSVSESSREM